MRPGTEVSILETPPPRIIPTDTGTAFAAGVTEQGPIAPQLVTSLNRFVQTYGARVSYSLLYDSLELFFNEGGSQVYVARVVGPNPVKATKDIAGASGDVLRATALYYGAYANTTIKVGVDNVGGGNFDFFVTDGDGTELERKADLADTTEAIDWSQNSAYVRLSQLTGTGDPSALAATALSSGTDDHANITQSEYDDALAQFTSQLGPGQVLIPGVTTDDAHEALLDHALANNRFAVLDLENTDDVSTLEGDAAALNDLDSARYGEAWGNWLVIRGLLPGTTRTVPPSGAVAGLMAKNDRKFSPNRAAAGDNGRTVSVIDLATTFTEAQGAELNAAGVNTFRQVGNVIEAYGNRTLALKDDAPNWWQGSTVRLFMVVVAKGRAAAERYVFAEIDGQRKKLAQLEGDLRAVVAPYYVAGSLYGETPDDAYAVDATSKEVNPDDQLADGVVKGVIYLRVSPAAELVRLEVVKVRLPDTIPA